MNKVMKILAVCSAVLLIFWDLFTLSDLTAAASGAEAFGIFMRAMLPCGLLFGVTVLLHLFQKSGKKPLAVITAVFFGAMALIRLFALVIQFMEIAAGTAASDTGEILLILEFIAYLLLAVSAVFLMVHMIGGRLRRTTQAVFAAAAGLLLIDWIVVIYQQVNEMIFVDTSFLQIVLTIFTTDFIWSITSLIAYTLCFGCITKAFEPATTHKENNNG